MSRPPEPRPPARTNGHQPHRAIRVDDPVATWAYRAGYALGRAWWAARPLVPWTLALVCWPLTLYGPNMATTSWVIVTFDTAGEVSQALVRCIGIVMVSDTYLEVHHASPDAD
jgi:hypothetical protein